MPDRVLRGIVSGQGLRVVLARVTETARIARVLHGCYPTSALLLAQALAAGVLLGALQKGKSRVNLQLECDGPVGGFLVDADADGAVRAYVRRPEVNFPGDAEAGVRASLGGSGRLSVVRDLGGGDLYRGSVELPAPDLAEGLRRHFAESEQVATALDLRVVPRQGEPLGEVAGILLQRMPGGDEEALGRARARIAAGALRDALAGGASGRDVLRSVAGGDLEILAEAEVGLRCECSAARARASVSVLGLEGIRDVLAREREAVVTCQFCRQRYVVGEDELRDMERRLAAAGP